jgi:hypothetical protein
MDGKNELVRTNELQLSCVRAFVGGQIGVKYQSKDVAKIAIWTSSAFKLQLVPDSLPRDSLNIEAVHIVGACGSIPEASVNIEHGRNDVHTLTFSPPSTQDAWIEWMFDHTAPTLPLKVAVKKL